MSRIGLKPITVPSGVTISMTGSTCLVKGPKGELSNEIPDVIKIDVSEGVINVVRDSDERQAKALHGLTRALVANNVEGVEKGDRKSVV